MLGRLDLEGLFIIHVLQLYSLVDRFWLRGLRRGFSPSTSVSSSITRLGVILYLHISFLLFKLYIYCLLFIVLAYAIEYCSGFITTHLLLFHT